MFYLPRGLVCSTALLYNTWVNVVMFQPKLQSYLLLILWVCLTIMEAWSPFFQKWGLKRHFKIFQREISHYIIFILINQFSKSLCHGDVSKLHCSKFKGANIYCLAVAFMIFDCLLDTCWSAYFCFMLTLSKWTLTYEFASLCVCDSIENKKAGLWCLRSVKQNGGVAYY